MQLDRAGQFRYLHRALHGDLHGHVAVLLDRDVDVLVLALHSFGARGLVNAKG